MGHYLLAQMAARHGQADEAEEHYVRCLDVVGEDPELTAERNELIRSGIEKRLAAPRR